VQCEAGLDAMRNYHREWDPDRKILTPEPVHDWSSHAADAFRYLAGGLKEAPSPELDRWGRPRAPEAAVVREYGPLDW